MPYYNNIVIVIIMAKAKRGNVRQARPSIGTTAQDNKTVIKALLYHSWKSTRAGKNKTRYIIIFLTVIPSVLVNYVYTAYNICTHMYNLFSIWCVARTVITFFICIIIILIVDVLQIVHFPKTWTGIIFIFQILEIKYVMVRH